MCSWWLNLALKWFCSVQGKRWVCVTQVPWPYHSGAKVKQRSMVCVNPPSWHCRIPQVSMGIPGDGRVCSPVWPSHLPRDSCTQLSSSMAPCGGVCVWAWCIQFHWRYQCYWAMIAVLQSTYYGLLISRSCAYWMCCFPPICLPRLGWGGLSTNSIHSGFQPISIPTPVRGTITPSCALL